MRLNRHALAFFVSLISAGALSAAGPGRYVGDAWALLDEKQEMAAATGIAAAKYADCDAATIDEKIERVYRADGTGECQYEFFSKILTEKGKRGNRTISLSFMLPYSRIEIYKLEIITPKGDIQAVNVAANSVETIDDRQMDQNIYDPNVRLLKVGIPKLDIGDVVHTVIRDTTYRPFMPGQTADENLLEGNQYIRHFVCGIRAPKDRPIAKIALRDEIPGKIAYTDRPAPDGGVIHRWEVSDVPRIFDEPDEPPYMEILQRLYVSTTPSWQDVSKWYWELSRPHLDAVSAELRAKEEELTANAKSDEEKMRAVFFYVSKNIRYMGLTPEKDKPGFEPHDVKLTFEKKYGVCRDKAALLVEMLRLAGLEAYPVLISVDAKKDAEIPDPYFDHAIVAVATGQGGYTLMDPTDEHMRQLLPYYDDDRSYLVCRPEGEVLKLSPVEPPDDNMVRIATSGVLTAGGELRAKSTFTFGGVFDDSCRNAFAHMKSEELLQFFESRLKLAQPGARVISLKLRPDSSLDSSAPLKADLEFSIGGLAAAGEKVSVLTLPWIGKSIGVIDLVLDSAGLDSRKYSLKMVAACGLEEELTVKLDEGYGGPISLPEPTSVEDESLAYRQDVGVKDGALECRREFEIKGIEFSPEEYLKLKKTLKSIDYDERKSPVLAMSAAIPPAVASAEPAVPEYESNTRVLDDRKEVDLIDAHDFVYKVSYSEQILAYAGKVKEAEVKVDFDPACDRVKLTRGVVISASGARQEISPGEIHVMDAGWDASAKRYTGGKVLVANLPGVEIGSTIEVAYEIAVRDKPFLSGFESFRLSDRLDRKIFVLTAPENLVIQKRVGGPAGAVVEKEEVTKGRRTIQWQAEGIDPLPSESSLPPAWVYEPSVAYFVGDPAADLKALEDAMVKRSSAGARAAETARKLTADCKTKEEAIAVIRDFVAASIRQAGPYFAALPLRELSPADTTLSEGYGHSADRAILLFSMLKAAGFDPQFVLASQLPAIPAMSDRVRTFPSLSDFRSPLVRVVVDSQAYYLNDTDQYAKLGSTAADGSLGLNLSTQLVEEIRAAQGCSNATKAEYSLKVAEDGSARIDVTLRYFGGSYNEKKRYFSELPPEQRRRYFQQVVSGVAQGARAVSELSTSFGDYPGTESYAIAVDNFAVANGDYLYFSLPFAPSLFQIKADSRTLPYFISRSSNIEGSVSVALPRAFRTILVCPKSEGLAAPDGGGRVTISETATDQGCDLRFKLEASPAIIDARDYPALLSLESSLEQRSARTFLLAKD